MKKRISKKLVITTGVLALMLFAPAAPKSTIGQAISTVTNQIEVQAAQTYSDNWKEDAAGNWHFYNDDGTLVTNSWVHDYGEWYLLDSTGTMRTGVFRSNGGKYYILDTVRGTGTYGKLLKDGMVYQGVVLHADTSATYEGALDNETLEQLAAVGVEVVNVPDVENTIHVDKDAERASLQVASDVNKQVENKEMNDTSTGNNRISEESKSTSRLNGYVRDSDGGLYTKNGTYISAEDVALLEMFGASPEEYAGGSDGGAGGKGVSINDIR